VLALAAAGIVLTVAVRHAPFDVAGEPLSLRGTSEAVRQGKAIRWLMLLEASYLAGDVFSAFVCALLRRRGGPPSN